MAVHPRGTVRRALIGAAAASITLLAVLAFTPARPASELTTFTVAGVSIDGHLALPVKAMGSFSKGDL